MHMSHRCIGMVHPDSLSIGDNGAFPCIPMKIGVKFEHCGPPLNQHCKSTGGQVPPDDHTKLICTAALWVYPLAAHRSSFVCARKLAQKHTSLPTGGPPQVPNYTSCSRACLEEMAKLCRRVWHR